MLVVTILIQTHGKVININLDSHTLDIFQNVRLLCKASGFKDNYMNFLEENMLYGYLSNIFKKDIETSTKEIIDNAKSGIIIGNVTYDKSLSALISNPSLIDRLSLANLLQGIYLLSIHDEGRLIYPNNMEEPVINLMKLNDLYRLARFFNTQNNIPNLLESKPFPTQKIYIDKEEKIKLDKKLSDEEKQNKIKSIRREFYTKLNEWDLTVRDNSLFKFNSDWYIDPIRLSKLIELVKIAIGQPCFINVLDYSCNSQTMYIPEEDKPLSKYALQYDEEQGMPNMMRLGGKKRIKRRNKSKKSKSKSSRSRSRSRK